MHAYDYDIKEKLASFESDMDDFNNVQLTEPSWYYVQ